MFLIKVEILERRMGVEMNSIFLKFCVVLLWHMEVVVEMGKNYKKITI